MSLLSLRKTCYRQSNWINALRSEITQVAFQIPFTISKHHVKKTNYTPQEGTVFGQKTGTKKYKVNHKDEIIKGVLFTSNSMWHMQILSLETNDLFPMWQTLPPIRSSDQALGGPSPRPSRAEQRAQQQTGQERRRRPEPPRPTVLHLGVTARSHSLMEYQTHFPTQFNTHYINRYKSQQRSDIFSI